MYDIYPNNISADRTPDGINNYGSVLWHAPTIWEGERVCNTATRTLIWSATFHRNPMRQWHPGRTDDDAAKRNRLIEYIEQFDRNGGKP